MSDRGATIREFLAHSGMTQSDLAREVGISQSSVSRAIDRGAPGNGRAGRAIFRFMQKNAPVLEPPRASVALRETWDMTPGHDLALERLILAADALRPKMEE